MIKLALILELIAMFTYCFPVPNHPYTQYPLFSRADVLLIAISLSMVTKQ